MLVVPALSLPRAQVIAAVVAAVVAAGEALAEAARLVLLAAVAATATEKAPSVPVVGRRATWLGSTTSERPPSPAALTPLPLTLLSASGGAVALASPAAAVATAGSASSLACLPSVVALAAGAVRSSASPLRLSHRPPRYRSGIGSEGASPPPPHADTNTSGELASRRVRVQLAG